MDNEDLSSGADTSPAGAGDAGAAGEGNSSAASPAAASTPEAGKEQPAPDATAALFGPQWRETAIAGMPEDQRDKATNYLKTRTSPYDVIRSAMAADSKISELTANRGVKVPTGKNDDPKDVEEYRKAKGVPDDIEKYNFDVPQEYGDLTHLDSELKSDFLKRAQAAHWNNADVKIATDMWWQAQKMYAADRAKAAAVAQQEAMDEIRIEFGKDYRANIEGINRMMAQEMARVGLKDPAERHAALSEPLADGRTLGDLPWFVKMMNNFQQERSDAGTFIQGETADGGDVDARIRNIVSLSQTDPKEYERMQPELDKLIAVQNRRKGVTSVR